MRLLFSTAFLAIAGALVLIAHEIWFLPDGRLHVRVLDVQQGDSILLQSPSGKQVLVDGGPDLSTLEYLGKYMPFFDRSIDLVILTHPHDDHIAALPEILRRYSVGALLLAGTRSETPRYLALLEEASQRHVPIIFADPAQDIALGDGTVLDILWPDTQATQDKNPNNASVVIRVLSAQETVLLSGDIEEPAENALLASGADVRAEFFKMPHHGSDTSSSTGFLLAINPQEAFLSVGKENSFGHPRPSTLARYSHFGIPLHSTAQEGTLSVLPSPLGQER
ncbi:MAG: MBL fold metallo-hydrolase [Candidatus Peribacteraceae bacterium]|jgi:competence protein ComEC